MGTGLSARGGPLAAGRVNIPPGSRILVRVRAAVSGPIVTTRFWVLTPDDRLVSTTLTSTALVQGVDQLLTSPVAEGELVSASATGDAGLNILQETWVQASLQDATRLGFPTVAIILSGFVGGLYGPVWPEDPLGAGIPADPGATVITVADPAAGADWSYTLLGESFLEVISVTARLTTSAAVANRRVSLFGSAGGQRFWQFPSANLQTASLIRTYVWSHVGAVEILTASVANLPMARLALATGNILGVATALIDVGDQWDQIRLLVRRRVEVV